MKNSVLCINRLNYLLFERCRFFLGFLGLFLGRKCGISRLGLILRQLFGKEFCLVFGFFLFLGMLFGVGRILGRLSEGGRIGLSKLSGLGLRLCLLCFGGLFLL